MIYLFIMFFILEFIVVAMLCYGICLFDKKVRRLTEQIKTNRHTLKFRLRSIYQASKSFNNLVLAKKRAAIALRKKITRGIIRTVLITALLFLFKNSKFKNKVLFVDLLLVLYDTLKATCFAL